MGDVSIEPLSHPFSASFAPPGSKSLTNRALVLAALAAGTTQLSNVLVADDTRVMMDGLKRLGFALTIDEGRHIVDVSGMDGKIPISGAELFCGNSGTTIRFLAALCALGKGEFVLDGTPRMRERPIGELVELLRHLGARVNYNGQAGFPPVRIDADGLPGGFIKFGSAQSSQFLSAVLMVAPYARHEVRVGLIGRQTSWPYVAMTMQLMDRFGVTPELIRDPDTQEPKQIIIPPGVYCGGEHAIEPDASAASYFLAAAAIHAGSKITIPGLGRESLQGDVAFANVLESMGASKQMTRDSISVTGTDELHGVDVDLSSMPDTAQTLAVAALFAKGRTTIRGLATLRVKETDRLSALKSELTKLGAKVVATDDTLTIDPPASIHPAEIATYDDHRMAMSFALAATKAAGVVIKDAQCVNKTYPDFFADLGKTLGIKINPI